MTDPTTTIECPQRRLPRSTMRGVGRMLVAALTRTKTTGLDHFPQHGPLTVVGNHIAALEVVLMVICAPWQMEMIGPVEGHAVEAGLRELRTLALWAVDNECTLRLQPIRRYRLGGQPEEIVEQTPGEVHQW